ncbi:MAG: amidase [Solirubrobacteraceae bacterium]|jgi:amidase|nr:amidase [Solirubrobacteraceae bacterium]
MDATDLAYAGAARQAQLIAAGEVSAREVVEGALRRIERLDPRLNAFRVVLGERALAEADQADARRRAGEARPLLGVPVAIKDDTDVAGVPTARGTAASDLTPRDRDAEVVRRLRAAGAIVVGKTNVPELMMWPFTESVSYGAARNPWSLAHTPGGSSGGSGAAVAAGLCGVALGTDGAGSVRIPAAFCGLFGLKPQRGRVPLEPGASAGWHGLNTVGPLARTVADAALFLDVVADGAPEGGFAAAAARAPRRLRIAVSTNMPAGVVARLGGEQRRAVEETAELLRSLGHDVVERDVDYGRASFLNVLARYLRGIHDEASVVPHPERLEPRTRAMIRRGRLVARAAITRARDTEAGLAARIGAVFATADVVLLPGPTGPPFRVGRLAGRGAATTLNAAASRIPYYGIFNATGHPACSLPAGFDGDGLPLAVQLAGRPHDEATLLALAARIEQARPWAERRPAL